MTTERSFCIQGSMTWLLPWLPRNFPSCLSAHPAEQAVVALLTGLMLGCFAPGGSFFPPHAPVPSSSPLFQTRPSKSQVEEVSPFIFPSSVSYCWNSGSVQENIATLSNDRRRRCCPSLVDLPTQPEGPRRQVKTSVGIQGGERQVSARWQSPSEFQGVGGGGNLSEKQTRNEGGRGSRRS